MSVTNSQIEPPYPQSSKGLYCEGLRTCPTCDGTGVDPMFDEDSLIEDLICITGATPKCSTCQGEKELLCENPTEYDVECEECGHVNEEPTAEDFEDIEDTDYGDWRNHD